MIFEQVRLDEFVERKCRERRAEHRGQVKETEKSSGIGSRVSRTKCPLGSNATSRGD